MESLYTSPDAVAAYALERIPSLESSVVARRLTKGRLNFVWRVTGATGSVIVKVMAPFAASDSTIRLDRRRVSVEASALLLLSSNGHLRDVSISSIRTPALLDHNPDRDVLIIEDCGDVPDLRSWMQTETDSIAAAQLGMTIGAYIGRLHGLSSCIAGIAPQIRNAQIQRTRLETQYWDVARLFRDAGVRDAHRLGRRAIALGKILCRPGCVFVMGDLWPHSVLVEEEGLAVIDWEMAHWGRPAQDVSHFAAHLWMLEHRASDMQIAAAIRRVRTGFFVGYRDSLGERFEGLFGPGALEQCRIHAGAEILIRTVGRFRQGYLYDNVDPTDMAIRDAVETAASLIRGEPSNGLFDALDHS